MASPLPASVVIETENFLVRPLGRDDACAALESWTEDETAVEMLNARRRQWSIAEQVAYFAQNAGKATRCLLGLFPKGKNEPVGMFIVKLRPADSIMLVTHFIGNKEWRGTGASREASIGIFDFFFNKLDYRKAKARVRLLLMAKRSSRFSASTASGRARPTNIALISRTSGPVTSDMSSMRCFFRKGLR